MALDWQTIDIPLAAGLDTKTDSRALQPPALSRADNVQFDETGGIQKRLPYTALPIVDLDGATITNLRRLATVNDELLLFTKNSLYSYASGQSAWVNKGDYLAPKMTEQSVFVRTSEQTECDRAELGGVVFYAWLDSAAAATTDVYLGALDATTGTVILAPTVQAAVSGAVRPRLVALTDKVLLFVNEGTGLGVKALDPTDPATGAAASFTTILDPISSYYDVVKKDGTTSVAVWRNTPTTSYGYATVTEALVVTDSSKARDCDGPIAVAVSPDDDVVVMRANGTSIRGDILTSGMVDTGDVNIVVGTASGTPVNQLTAAFSSTEVSGAYTCHAVWSAEESVASSDFLCETNTLDTAGTAGTESTIVHRMGVASRAFNHDGDVFVWVAFAQTSRPEPVQLQNTYFLYRTDGTLIAKAAPAVGGGLTPITGYLPHVQALDSTSYACALVERRIIPLGSDLKGYQAQSPRSVTVEFDSDDARRVVQLGATMYLCGGQVLQYDGEELTEVGFHVYPYSLDITDSSAGSMGAGAYTWISSIAWQNAMGEQERSTTATFFDLTMGASREASISLATIPVTMKTSRYPALEVWRTAVAPVLDSPYYLVTDKDPDATGDNGYLANDPTTYGVALVDSFADATLIEKETYPENGGILENIAPPAASSIAASADRIYLAGIPNEPQMVAYSKLRSAGEIAAFNDALTVRVPSKGGAITALAFLNDTLIAFQETAIRPLTGFGFDNAGQGSNFTASSILSGDVGAESADAVAEVPQGVLFKSAKGWYLLDRGFSVQYIGGPVADYDSEAVLSIDVLESQHQIRALTASRMLVWDYLVNQWAVWTISSAAHSVMHGGVHHYCTSSAVYKQDPDFSNGTLYAMDVETAWIKLSGLQGYQKIRRIMVLGEYRSAHTLRIRLARDYNDTYFDDTTWTPSPTTVGGPEQVRHSPSISKCQAIKIRITEVSPDLDLESWLESLRLTGITIEYGSKRGTFKGLPAAQKQ